MAWRKRKAIFQGPKIVPLDRWSTTFLRLVDFHFFLFFFFLFPSSCGCLCSDISFKFLSSILRFSHMCTMRKKFYSPAPIHMNLSISSQHNPPNFKPFLKNNPLNTMNAFHMCVSMIQPLEHGKLKSGYILNR